MELRSTSTPFPPLTRDQLRPSLHPLTSPHVSPSVYNSRSIDGKDQDPFSPTKKGRKKTPKSSVGATGGFSLRLLSPSCHCSYSLERPSLSHTSLTQVPHRAIPFPTIRSWVSSDSQPIFMFLVCLAVSNISIFYQKNN